MNLSHLKDKNFWMKGASILMWSFHLSVYIWLFSYLQGSQSHLHKFTGVAASVLVGGIGFTSITNLYNTKRTEFNPKYFYSALSIFVLFGCGAWAAGAGRVLFPVLQVWQVGMGPW